MFLKNYYVKVAILLLISQIAFGDKSEINSSKSDQANTKTSTNEIESDDMKIVPSIEKVVSLKR